MDEELEKFRSELEEIGKRARRAGKGKAAPKDCFGIAVGVYFSSTRLAVISSPVSVSLNWISRVPSLHAYRM